MLHYSAISIAMYLCFFLFFTCFVCVFHFYPLQLVSSIPLFVIFFDRFSSKYTLLMSIGNEIIVNYIEQKSKWKKNKTEKTRKKTNKMKFYRSITKHMKNTVLSSQCVTISFKNVQLNAFFFAFYFFVSSMEKVKRAHLYTSTWNKYIRTMITFNFCFFVCFSFFF